MVQDLYAQLPSCLLVAVAEVAARRMTSMPGPARMEHILDWRRRSQMYACRFSMDLHKAYGMSLHKAYGMNLCKSKGVVLCSRTCEDDSSGHDQPRHLTQRSLTSQESASLAHSGLKHAIDGLMKP